jgi:nigerose phosphorylase
MSRLWTVECEEFAGDSDSVMRTGNIYQIANGYMGYRGTLDEYGRTELVAVTLAGLFDGVGDAWREPVNAPNGGFTQVALDGEPVSALTARPLRHRHSLDLRSAVFRRETTLGVGAKTLSIHSTRVLSAHNPHLGFIEYGIRCSHNAALRIATGIDWDIWDLNGPHILAIGAERVGDVLVVSGTTSEASKHVAVAEGCDIAFGIVTYEVNAGNSLRVVDLEMDADTLYVFRKCFAVYTDNDHLDSRPADAAVNDVTEALRSGYKTCLAEHNACWAEKWRLCDVRIAGDDEAQLALRYSIFQLLIAAPVGGSGNSIPARALSGQVYKGAVFWDTEMFMLPFFLHTYPEKAVELLRYRIRTLPGARRKARAEGVGYRGAFYAWESQDTGDDACSYFNIGDPLTNRQLRTHFRDKQVHISGDVARAMWEYFKLTGDEGLLLQGGAEVILECARFYYSYAYYKKGKNRYEILDVIGPDEYHERVNNNAYTNMIARMTFEIAGEVASYLANRHSSEWSSLLNRLQIAEELPLFANAAKQLYVPAPDPESNLIEQFDGYFDLKDVTLDDLRGQRLHPDEYLGAGQGLAVPTKVIKQADVVMMLSVFGNLYSREVKRANWEYYEPRTEHASSLSASAYALVAAAFGDRESAYEYFIKTATIDLEGAYKVRVGSTFTGGSHPAANAGAWMVVVFGFGGLSAGEKAVTINPSLYGKWESLEFGLAFKGDRFQIRMSNASVEVSASSTNAASRTFVVWGNEQSCAPGQTLWIVPPVRSSREGELGVPL